MRSLSRRPHSLRGPLPSPPTSSTSHRPPPPPAPRLSCSLFSHLQSSLNVVEGPHGSPVGMRRLHPSYHRCLNRRPSLSQVRHRHRPSPPSPNCRSQERNPHFRRNLFRLLGAGWTPSVCLQRASRLPRSRTASEIHLVHLSKVSRRRRRSLEGPLRRAPARALMTRLALSARACRQRNRSLPYREVCRRHHPADVILPAQFQMVDYPSRRDSLQSKRSRPAARSHLHYLNRPLPHQNISSRL
jgi:hypothetical protein